MPKRPSRAVLALASGASGLASGTSAQAGIARYLREVFVEKTLQELAAAFLSIGEGDMASVVAEEARVYLDIADRLEKGLPVLDPPTKKGARR